MTVSTTRRVIGVRGLLTMWPTIKYLELRSKHHTAVRTTLWFMFGKKEEPWKLFS